MQAEKYCEKYELNFPVFTVNDYVEEIKEKYGFEVKTLSEDMLSKIKHEHAGHIEEGKRKLMENCIKLQAVLVQAQEKGADVYAKVKKLIDRSYYNQPFALTKILKLRLAVVLLPTDTVILLHVDFK